MALPSILVSWAVTFLFSRLSFAAPNGQLDTSGPRNSTTCRCFPGDECWPTVLEWASFNQTVGGRLIATVPIGAVCHHSDLASYDAAACEALREKWWYPETHLATSSSPMAPIWANASCDPFTAPDEQCVTGTYVQYAVQAVNVADYQATLAFAAQRNIRFVIRNTGHDYFGKSTGAGALALWTHSLKDTEFIDNYESLTYSGKALKFGAGVSVLEAYQAADAAGIAVVAGDCQTVGVAGGFSQGGGHGPLMSLFGLGADQVLEWEVVTAQGKHLIASPSNNSDLYWALSGGGGGTYAAVVSLTVRAHQLHVVSAATLTFSSANVSEEVFREAVQTFLMTMPTLGKAGIWASWLYYSGTFSLSPIFGPNLSIDNLQDLLEPTLSFINSTGIEYEYEIQEYKTFLQAYTSMVAPNNITAYNIGGRLIPKSSVETRTSATALLDVFDNMISQGAVVSGTTLDVSGFPYDGIENSVNPVWRDAIMDLVIGLPYNALDFEANLVLMDKMTASVMPPIEALTPGGGAYINEGNPQQPDWQTVFYGTNYAELEGIKAKYDLNDLFYGLTAVGSTRWTSKKDGRLCRT